MTFEYIDLELRKLLDDKEGARRDYMKRVTPQGYHCPLESESCQLLRDWLSISLTFELHSPWYSKDDRPFHVLDNPVHKDHVFGTPFMPASSWKGLLRWACRMQTGLLDHLEKTKNEFKRWKDSEEITHLFGTQRDLDEVDQHIDGEPQERVRRGALAFRPTWFDRVGFELINPHDRDRKAGTNPILYEVVPAKAGGSLELLYAPAPGQAERDEANAVSAISLLLDATDALITQYGFSAKRSSGWGLATIKKRSIQARGHELHEGSLDELKKVVGEILGRNKP